MLYKKETLETDLPHASSQRKPSRGKLFINGLMAKMINQPINTYIRVETNLYLPVKNSFKMIPVIANPQIIPKIIQPMEPCRVTSAKGVYVPAMRT